MIQKKPTFVSDMIQFADNQTQAQVRAMWETCFGDSQEFMDLYFTQKYKHENTLLYIHRGEALASVQMLPYTMRLCGQLVPVAYISGACTLPQHRHKGYMELLMREALQTMKDRHIPISILIPAEDWLYDFYRKYGYEQTFEQHGKAIDLDPIIARYDDNIELAYTFFDEQYQQSDFCLLKSQADFATIVEEYKLDSSSDKYNLAGMARITDAESLLTIFAENNAKLDFSIGVTDKLLNTHFGYRLSQGRLSPLDSAVCQLQVDVQLLARLLFGYRTSELGEPYKSLFVEHCPSMSLMLE